MAACLNFKSKAAALLILAICFAVLALKEYRPFSQLSNISFESMAKNRIESNADTLSAFFALSNALIDSLKHSLPLIPKDYETELSRALRTQIDETHAQGIFIYDSGWAAYLPRGARTFANPDERNIRTYQSWFKKADSLGFDKNWAGPVFDDCSKSRIIYRIMPIENGFLLISHSVSGLYAYMQGIGISRYGSPYILDTAGNFIVNNMPGKHGNDLVAKIPNMPFYLGVSVYPGDSQETGAYQGAMRKIFFRMLAYSVISILLFLFCAKALFTPAGKAVYFLIPVCLLGAIIISITVFYRYPGSSSGRVTASDYEEHPYSESDRKILKENGVDFKWNPALVIDQKAVDFFVSRYQNRSDSLYGSQAKILPTGVMINSIRFTRSNVILATGFAWQKFLITGEQYPRKISRKYLYDDYDNKGVEFFGGHNEGSYGGAFELTDSLETTMDGYKAILMRWSFVVELEQVPYYGLYPFGVYSMPFTIKAKNKDENTMLTPDISAYSSMFPIDKPGIDSRLEILGWDISQSFYSYRFGRSSSNLGNVNSQSRAPDIRLNLSISAKFINILVSKLLSVMVIVTLLFVLIFIREKDNILNSVLGCASLFFALVLDHVNLRERVQSVDVMYLEFIYLTIYGFLLLTVLSSIYLKKVSDMEVARLNSYMRNYFWSVFFGVMAVATMWRFY